MLMFDKDHWQEIFDSLHRHKLRTFLTAFGVFWGIFMLVNLIGMGKGLQNGAMSGFGGSANSVFFWGGRPTTLPYEGMAVGRAVRMNDGDLAAIKAQVNHVKYFAPGNGFGQQVAVRGTKSESFDTAGVSPFEDEVKNYDMLHGRFINALDMRQARKTIVIGDRVKEVLFAEDENPIGQRIRIAGIPFLVVGVFAPTGVGDWSQQDRNKILLPMTTLRKIVNYGDVIHWITMVPEDGYRADIMQKNIISILQARHKVHPDDKGVFGTFNLQEEFERWQGVFTAIITFSWVVAIGTIIAGVVGVGNIMLITVKERTKEIGIRKAIGATPANIVSTIVQESLLLTLVSGYLGLVAGVWAVEGVAALVASGGKNSTFSNPEVSFSTAIIALVVLLVAGALASLLPAKKAAGVNPVIALQDE